MQQQQQSQKLKRMRRRMQRRRRQPSFFSGTRPLLLLFLLLLVVAGCGWGATTPIAASASATTTSAPMIAFRIIFVPFYYYATSIAQATAAAAVEGDDHHHLLGDDDDDALLLVEELPGRPPLSGSGDDEHHGDEDEKDKDEDVVDGLEEEVEEEHRRHDSDEEDEESSSLEEGEANVSADDDDQHDDAGGSPPLLLLQLTLDAFTSAEKYRALFTTHGRSTNVDDFMDDNFPRTLVLALVVHDNDDNDDDDSSPSCPHTPILLETLRAAASQLQHIPTLRLGILPLRDATSMRALGIDRVPSLIFVTWLNDDDNDSSGSVVLMEYNGLWTTSDDIAQTATHYWHRLVDATSGWDVTSSTSTHSNSNTVVSVKVPHYDSYDELQHYLRTSQLLNPTLHPRVLVPLPPTISDGDIRFVRWLLREEDDHEQADGGPYSLPDDSKLFVQCRQSSMEQIRSAQVDEAYRMFDQASRALSNRRDCFFATVENCGSVHIQRGGGESRNEAMHNKEDDDQDGTVAAFSIPYDWDYEYMNLVTNLDPSLIRHRPNTDEPNVHHASASALIHDIAQFARPSVLWFDRQSTAPIVFGVQQTHHAVLVVDMHPVMTGSVKEEEQEETESSTTTNRRVDDMRSVRNVFNQFRRECRKPANRHVACLVVPSTETRVLTTLGIDIWTPLDNWVFSTSRQHHSASSVDAVSSGVRPLPVLIMTDRQRVEGKTLRYRLDREQLLGDGDNASASSISKFFDDFVSHRLEPVVKSDPRGPRTNAAGVRILTGHSLHELEGVVGTDGSRTSRHALILFVSPTCGHCKRASVVWDRLSRFLKRVHWSSIVQLYKMDVTENDVPDGVTPRWFPDAYHYDRSSTSEDGNSGTFTRFDWIQDDGGGGDETSGGGGRGDVDDNALSSAFGIDWDVPTLLNWFVSVTNWTDAELSDLLADLEQRSQ